VLQFSAQGLCIDRKRRSDRDAEGRDGARRSRVTIKKISAAKQQQSAKRFRKARTSTGSNEHWLERAESNAKPC
jgi:hypothetical protein